MGLTGLRRIRDRPDLGRCELDRRKGTDRRVIASSRAPRRLFGLHLTLLLSSIALFVPRLWRDDRIHRNNVFTLVVVDRHYTCA